MKAYNNFYNSIIDFDNITMDSYDLEHYTSFNFSKVTNFISNFDNSYFAWYLCENDDKLERISYEIYGTECYWDILLLLNKKNPLFDMTYNYDTLSNIADDKVLEYQSKYSQVKLSPSQYEYLKEKFLSELVKNNEANRYILYVVPSLIGKFISECYMNEVFK